MIYVIDAIRFEIKNIIDPLNFAIFSGGLSLIYIAFFIVYRIIGKEFIRIDFTFSAFEKDFWSKGLWYFRWAALQQVLALTLGLAVLQISENPILAYVFSVLLFALGYHFRNWRLVGFTFCFAAVFYFAWFFLGFQSLVYLSALHAFGGTAFYKTGLDMRVWGIE